MAKILIVDDELFVRMKMKNFLEPLGHEILQAESGTKAVKLFETNQVDLVFCDVMMRGIDGIETLKRIRAVDPKAKVVMLSALGGHQVTLVDAISNGAVDILPKPYKEEKLIAIIKRILG